MDRITTEVAHQFLKVENAPTRNVNLPSSASCAALQVTYLPRLEESRLQPIDDRIEILMPGESGLFHAMYEAPEGHPQRAVVRAPHICVVPPNQRYRLVCQGQTDLVAMSLDIDYFASRVQEAFGGPREVVERYGAND